MFTYVRLHVFSSEIQQAITLINQHLSFGLMNETYLIRMIQTGHVLIAKSNDQVVACAAMCELTSDDFLEHQDLYHQIKKESPLPHYLFAHLVVDPAFRGKGLAKTLTAHIHACLPIPCTVIGLGWVQPQGWEAEGLLRKWGYQTEAMVPAFWLDVAMREQATCPHCAVYCSCAAHVVSRTFTESISSESERNRHPLQSLSSAS